MRGRLSFGRREQEESDPDTLLELAGQGLPALPPGEAAELENLRLGSRVAGALLQSFQIQLDFLRMLPHARDGLTRGAAEEWFSDALEARDQDPSQWNVPALVTWLQDSELVELSPEGRLHRSDKGNYLIALADVFWYAPKAF